MQTTSSTAPIGTRQPSRDPHPGRGRVVLVGHPEREDSGGEGREDAQQQRPVPRVSERPRVAAVVHVVADVPQPAPHRREQADRCDDHRERGPPRDAQNPPCDSTGAREHLGAARAMRVGEPDHRSGPAEVDDSERDQLIDLRSAR